MKRRTFLLSTAGLASGWALGKSAWADDVSAVLAEMARARASVKTLVGTFVQERTMGLLATTVRSEGSMTMVRPDRLRWELNPPDAATYWITPKGLSYAMPHSKGTVPKGSVETFGAVLSDLLILLGGDLDKLRARYELAIPKRDTAGLTLIAKPKAAEIAKRVSRLEMTTGPELWRVKSFTIEEPSGDRSVIAFAKVERDVAIDPRKMQAPS
jgi:outer membrane lipoprotein-sorting protein